LILSIAEVTTLPHPQSAEHHINSDIPDSFNELSLTQAARYLRGIFRVGESTGETGALSAAPQSN
jgi:hypothetical protein